MANIIPVAFFQSAPVGAIACFAGSTAPKNWFFCNGRALNRLQYSALFDVIGTSWGSNGATDFLIPNLEGQFVFQDGLVAQRRSDSLGAPQAPFVVAEAPDHSHDAVVTASGEHSHGMSVNRDSGISYPYGVHDSGITLAVRYGYSGTGSNTSKAKTSTGGEHSHIIPANSSLGGEHTHALGNGAEENRPPSLTLWYCIFAGV